MDSALHILIVNDDEDAVFLLHRVLERKFTGATITDRRNARDALEFIGREPVHLILTDNQMPGMDGLTMVRHIRASNQNVPIIMLTGSEHLEAAALSAGVTLFIPPSDWAQIGERIRKVLTARPPFPEAQ